MMKCRHSVRLLVLGLILAASPLTTRAETTVRDLTPHERHAEDLLRELIAFESTSEKPEENRRAMEAMAAHLRAAGFGDDDHPLGVAAFLEDLTAQHRVDAIRKDFVANASHELKTSVMPFILRAVCLLGINSVDTPRDLRRAVWQRIGADLKPQHLDTIGHTTIAFNDLPDAFQAYIDGAIMGRTVVNIAG